MTIILWYRQDLRISNHTALHEASKTGNKIIPLYIHNEKEHTPWQTGPASNWWLHHSLEKLDQDLQTMGSRLVIQQGDSFDILKTLCQKYHTHEIYGHRLYEPHLRTRDECLTSDLNQHGIRLTLYDGNLITQPEAIKNQQGQPYKVFTPFYQAVLKHGINAHQTRTVKKLPAVDSSIESLDLQALNLIDPRRSSTFQPNWLVGEQAAFACIDEFINNGLATYCEKRDHPAIHGTSSLSAHLHFGEISVQQAARQLSQSVLSDKTPQQQADAVLRQLIWRDFAYHLLHHFPHTPTQAYNAKFADFPWIDDEHTFNAWKNGVTGIPIVDAGMHELKQSGRMHNRVRMITASFLCKHLLIDWRRGADWFWQNLVDADLALNTMNWQWVAGCGVDAAPYFRIMSPITQSKKFDARGDYIKKWLPQLRLLNKDTVQTPWLATADQLKKGGIRLGEDYPEPLIDVDQARTRALDYFKSLS